MNRAKTQASSADDRFFCVRLTCEMSGRDCVVYRGSERCVSCQGCDTGKQHARLFGSGIGIPEIRHCPVSKIQQMLRRKKIAKERCGVLETTEVREAIKAIARSRGIAISSDLFERIGVSSWFFYKTPWTAETMETCRAWLSEQQERMDLLNAATERRIPVSERFELIEI